ncbi:MAG TPA: DUF885 family protein [Vicinamibacterales bacterium]|nr:DUF885 family protein [Vicinamibacterales bacterium]
MRRRSALCLLSFVLSACATPPPPASSTAAPAHSTNYSDLTALFTDWRTFQQPKRVNGVPDYSPAAMATQRRDLASYVNRLAAIDPAGWPIPQQVDYHVVRAEMNGLDFDHRVLLPWANNPAFYVTVFLDESDQPAREGPLAAGGVDVWKYTFPLSTKDASEIAAGLTIVPALLEQAKTNLVGHQKDLWTYGRAAIKDQSAALTQLASRLKGSEGDLKTAIDRAKAATDALASWLDSQASSRTESSGIGVDNYNWYLKNVQLVPYTWQDELTLMERELTRSSAALVFEEQRHAKLPPQVPIASAAEHDTRFNAAVTEYMAFLKDHDLMTIRPDMDPGLRARIGTFSPGPREFFGEVDARDPEVMRTHGYHWFDKGWLANVGHASPIRKGALLYNIFNTRTEGFATAWEELMLEAGMFDARPRSRELVYILVAERGARAIGDLRMHSREFTLEQAAAFASANTPRGWLSLKGNLVRGEQFLYLQQPAYGTSYVIGKVEADKLITERKRQLGDQFTMRRFMDEFNAAGLVPIALLRWELTGQLPDDVARMLKAGK